MERTCWLTVFVACAACKSEDKRAAAPPTARMDDAALAPPGADPDDPVQVAVAGLPSISGPRGFLIGDTPGAQVTVHGDGGEQVAQADGAVVTQLEMPDHDARDPGDDSMTYVELSTGTRGMVATRSFVTVDLIDPAPQAVLAGWAVLRPQRACTEVDCFGDVWLVRGMAARWKLAERTAHVATAWRAAGDAMASSTDAGLAIVKLPDGTVIQRDKKLYSPAFAPDGTLYARAIDWSVWKLVDPLVPCKATLVARLGDPFGPPEPGVTAQPIQPPPVEFAADGTWKQGQDELDARENAP
jgi:hypothetical protein